MLLTSFDPFMQEFDRLTQQAFGWSNWSNSARAALPVDGIRREGDVVFKFDLPGVKLDDIDVSVDNGVLTVSAKRDEEKADAERHIIRERVTGSLYRRIYLGDAYDTDKVEAGYENGVLTVRVPVAERAKARKVEISSDSKKMIAA
ncbi:MAG TPA: Hsp20/alpha crystallin family protein [Streptosporangiaceae bacterium]|nr:Hsp20/alpha crystallin family protein [Streptosporangiaceae bacterium]